MFGCFKTGFFNLTIILCWTGYFSSGGAVLCIVGCLTTSLAYTHNSTSFSLVVTTKNVSRHCEMSPGSQNCPMLRTTALERRFCRRVMSRIHQHHPEGASYSFRFLGFSTYFVNRLSGARPWTAVPLEI